MDFKGTYTIKRKKRLEDMSQKELDEYTHFITKCAKTVRSPKNSLLEGEEAIRQKPRFKEIKGPNNDFLTRCLMDKSAVTRE